MRSEETADQILDAFLNTAHGVVRPLDRPSRPVSQPPGRQRNQDVQEQSEAVGGLPGAWDDNFVVEHQAKPELEGLHGVGIFVPSRTRPGGPEEARPWARRPTRSSTWTVDDDNDAANDWHRLVLPQPRDWLAPLNAAAAQLSAARARATGREDRASIAQSSWGIVRASRNLEQSLLRTKATGIGSVRSRRPAGAAVPDLLAVPREEHRYLRLASDVRQRKHAQPDPESARSMSTS